MNECLRCGKSCGNAIFCDLCQSSLLHRSQDEEQESGTNPPLPLPDSPLGLPSIQPIGESQALQAVPLPSPRRGVPTRQLYRVRSDLRQNTLQVHSPIVVESGEIPLRDRTATARRHALVRLRRAFIILVVMALLALLVDGALVSLIFKRNHMNVDRPAVLPVLTCSPGTVYPGQVALLRLDHFSAFAHVLLSRDIEEQIRLDVSSPLLQVGAAGDASVHVLVEDSWGPGLHFIQAEDIETHYIASAPVQVIGSVSALPPHFDVNQKTLDIGGDLQGTNSLQPLVLHNTGGGTISWSAVSNQSWLLLTPNQGTFSASERIMIAVSRAHLKAGSYRGTITFTADTGVVIAVEVKMSVLPLPSTTGAVLTVTPPALSFVAVDGGVDPAEQLLTVRNPGARPLYWSMRSSVATTASDGQRAFMTDMNWLTVQPGSGVVAPHGMATVHVVVHSHALLPGIYGGVLLFNAGQNALNNPQPVAVSLDIQPRCGIATSTGTLSFTTSAGQSRWAGQTLTLHLTAHCSENIPWQATSMATWLSITPAGGQMREHATTLTTVAVNNAQLSPGTYTGFIVFFTAQRTQTVSIQVTVLASSPTAEKQVAVSTPPASGGATVPGGNAPPGKKDTTNQAAPPTPGVGAGPDTGPTTDATTAGATIAGGSAATVGPALGVSPVPISFNLTPGHSQVQSIDIANTGGGTLYWQASSDSSWLTIASATGTISGGQASQVSLSAAAGGLPAGTYRANVYITATDSAGAQVAGGSQMLSVTLTIVQPCTLQVTPTNLQFSVTRLQLNAPTQNLTISEVGTCAQPVSWAIAVSSAGSSWLLPSSTSGSDSGSGSTISVHINAVGLLLGAHNGQMTVSATDNNGNSLQNSGQTITVTLTVL